MSWMTGWPSPGLPSGGRKRRTKRASKRSKKRSTGTRKPRRSKRSSSRSSSRKSKPARLVKGSAAAKAWGRKMRRLRGE